MIGLARNTDPSTSWDAAEIAVTSGMIAKHKALITAAMERIGKPMNAVQIGNAACLTQFQVSRRLKEMANVERGEKVKSTFGSWFYLWSLK